jgi:serine phosphatase RsbU (regulator of sigma subunit)/DNA-binding LacI/PurR family transcriptional regulator
MKISPTPHPALNSTFPTIGVLTEGLFAGQYQSGVWPGCVDAARRHKVNLICFCGGSLHRSTENAWAQQGNVLYALAQKRRLDGLLIFGSLGCYVSEKVFSDFVAGFGDRKIVTIAPASDDLPAVFVDNVSGMRSLITHCVEHHRYRNFAFINGPENNLEAAERFTVFREALAQFGIPVDPRRILNGDFSRQCGAAAVHALYSSGLPIDIIVAANDDTAFGALEALGELGKKVPEDVALVGFDDVAESRFVSPPLTTVRQPHYDLGKIALEKLLLLMRDGEVPRKTIVPGELVIRQSCGCFRNALAGDGRNHLDISPLPVSTTLSEREVLAGCAAVIDKSYMREVGEIVACFCQDVNDRADMRFLNAIEHIGRTLVLQERGIQALLALLHTVGQHALYRLERPSYAFADDLVHRAILICGNLGIREQGERRILSVRKNHFLHEIGDALKNTLDVDRLMDAVAEYFPRLGVHSLYLSLYEGSKKAAAEKSRLKCALVGGLRKPLSKAGIVFDTDCLIPPGIVPAGEAHILVVESLYFQNEQFGIVLFEADFQESGYYLILREFISAALHSAALIKKVRQQAEVLKQANANLKGLREKEYAYLQAIRRELELGRTIQMGFLPQTLPQLSGWEIAATFKPAREVGGDFYDAFMVGDDQVALVIADVSGKDVSAALFMSVICTLIRAFAERVESSGDDPLDAIKVVNDYIVGHHSPGEGRGSMFATIVFGILQPSSGVFRYINAGHIAPMIISSSGEIQTLPTTGIAVGLAGHSDYARNTIVIKPGDLFFLYTDGVTEAKNPEGEFFNKARLIDLLMVENNTAHEKVNLISAALDEHNEHTAPYDDITMLAVKRGAAS